MPKTVDTRRHCERSESIDATIFCNPIPTCFWGLRKIVACSHSSSQCLLVSTVFGTVSSLHPTMIFILVYYRVKVICKQKTEKLEI